MTEERFLDNALCGRQGQRRGVNLQRGAFDDGEVQSEEPNGVEEKLRQLVKRVTRLLFLLPAVLRDILPFTYLHP